MSGPGPSSLRFVRCGSSRRNCRGAAAVEFALVFLIFFSLFYAIVAYGLVLTLKQSLTQAAEEGARAAVQDAPDAATRLARAETMAKTGLGWLPGGGIGITVNATAAPCTANPATSCVTVVVNYDYAAHPIVPSLPLLGIAIPANLGATATVQY